MLQQIKIFIFGQRAQGEKLFIPTKRPERFFTQDEINQWTAEVRFGCRYGTKGSFYQTR